VFYIRCFGDLAGTDYSVPGYDSRQNMNHAWASSWDAMAISAAPHAANRQAEDSLLASLDPQERVSTALTSSFSSPLHDCVTIVQYD
jgi:hypothetical protein